jgi:YebC/PmpR family DNA-binding regulatory protein
MGVFMSGHSKWATTKRKKAAIDAKRGKIFTKLAKLITIAARDGKSGDINSNPSLRMAVENAKAASMPKDNIERAIGRGVGGGSGAAIEEVTYEAYAPGGIALLIECLTDNKNRTLGDIKAILNKNGGSLATSGSVAFQFKKIGQIIIDEAKSAQKGEELEMAIIDSGADNFDKEENLYVVETSFQYLHQVKSSLENAGAIIESAEFTQVAENLIDVPEDKKQSILDLVDKLDDLDDVSNVYSNLNL